MYLNSTHDIGGGNCNHNPSIGIGLKLTHTDLEFQEYIVCIFNANMYYRILHINNVSSIDKSVNSVNLFALSINYKCLLSTKMVWEKSILLFVKVENWRKTRTKCSLLRCQHYHIIDLSFQSMLLTSQGLLKYLIHQTHQ